MKILRETGLLSALTLQTKLNEIQTQHPESRVFLYFYGAENEQGFSWCSGNNLLNFLDCVVADPLVKKWIDKIPNSVLFQVSVGDKTE